MKLVTHVTHATRAVFLSGLVVLSACQSDGETPSPNLPITEPVATPIASATPKPSATPVATATPKPSSTPAPTATPAPGAQLYIGAPELAKYLNKFIDDAKMEGVDVVAKIRAIKLTIKVASLKSTGANTIGLCQTSGANRTVTFDTTFWNSNTETRREILVHHELGHCILKRSHLSTKLPNGDMYSIMTPYILSQAAYFRNYTHYIDELFASSVAKSIELGGVVSSDEAPKDYICDGLDHDE